MEIDPSADRSEPHATGRSPESWIARWRFSYRPAVCFTEGLPAPDFFFAFASIGRYISDVTEAAPKTIGRYRVVRELGSGGMGTVYLAEDPALRRQVAIKIVQGGLREQEQALVRFQREAEISAQLNHPNVITIYDVGTDVAVGPFIAMEFVDGKSLSAAMTEGSVPPNVRFAVLVQAARALQSAHAAGIVHRDVKPQNLMVARDGRVKLMDFGVARSDDSTLTMTGIVLGTPAYMAPEQIDGASPSAATDVYALAVVAFEVLCGRRPYVADTVSKLLYQIAHEAPSFPADLDRDLRAVFERALAKSPAGRYPDAQSLARALVDASRLDVAMKAKLHTALDGEDPLVPGRPPTIDAAVTVISPMIQTGAPPAASDRRRVAFAAVTALIEAGAAIAA